jgi:DNA invertase Pin-like site-specific DNA recombinase
MAVLDGYIRVSRVAGREGDAYRSPTQQRDAMESWTAQNAVELGKVIVEEDVTGKKRAKDRGLEELLKRAEAGVSDGVIVYRMSRFGRNMADTVASVERLKNAGARLVAVMEGYDTSQPNGQVLLGVYTGLAEQQLDERRENWKASATEAVEEGIHVACHAPIGFLRRDQVEPEYDSRKRLIRDGRLIVDSAAAPAIHTAFEMRAREESLKKITEYLRVALGRRTLAKSSVFAILKNRAYLGEARGPHGAVKKDAHEAIVSLELFAAAQRGGEYHPRDGSLASQSVLAGIIKCASCGRNLMIMGRRDPKTGGRKASYVCTAKYDGNDCERPAIGDVAKIDNYVLWRLQIDEEAVIAGVGSSETEYLEAKEALRLAEQELERFADPSLSTDLGPELWRRGITQAKEKVDTARTALWDLEDPGLPDDASIVVLDGKPRIYTVWGDDPDADRRTLRKLIANVTLEKCDHRRGWQPIEERVSITWVGQAVVA